MVVITARGARRLAWLPLIFCALSSAPASNPALAQAVGVEKPRPTAPLPPRRPPELGGAHPQPPVLRERPAQAAERAEPDKPANTPAGPIVAPLAAPPASLALRVELPPYDRRSMRICGEEWQVMKRDGRASGKIWRDFSAECLTRNQPR